MNDIAKRAYDHTFRLDPVIRSLLDSDAYKLLMLQVIASRHPAVDVTFEMINRTTSVRIGAEIDFYELRRQLDHARSLRFTERELVWLAGNSFFGTERIFTPETIAALRAFRLPDYELREEGGEISLRFHGRWSEVTMWEIPCLAIVNELRSRAALAAMSRFEIDVAYARAKSRLWGKVERLRTLRGQIASPLSIGDFGTRRRHGHLWQRWCCEALAEGLGASFAGTSNLLLAMELGVEALGTNAHEMAMVAAALAGPDPDAMRASRYGVLDDWTSVYGERLRVLLPDAYGTTSFLADAPAGTEAWTGARPDSKPPIEGGSELIAWWRSRGEDPSGKLLVLSDGMDVDSIEGTARFFDRAVRVSYGWGTDLTNDFAGCAPRRDRRLEAISLVCKVVAAGGRPAVKLSDNPAKATGSRDEVSRYLAVFGDAGMRRTEVSR